MAQTNLSSKKRKRPSSTTQHPFAGTFTRSKSQIYLHLNRSGRARSDSSCLDLYRFQSVFKRLRRRVLAKDQDSSNANDLSCILIKDLRTRRVFSDGCGFRGENEEGKGLEEGIGRLESGFSSNSSFGRDVVNVDDCLGDSKMRKSEDDMEELDTGFCFKDLTVDDPNLSLLTEDPRNDEVCGLSSGVAVLNGESIQKTPPDTEILISMKEVEQNRSQRVAFVSKSTNRFVEKQSNGSNQKRDNCIGEAFSDNINKRNSTSSRTNSFLSPCSRVKLFKAPGSFSYRRLLPYLMDISKDNSCALKMVQPPKSEKGPEEKQLFTPQVQEIWINESKTESPPFLSNNVDIVKESNSTPMECKKESSMSFEAEKEVPMDEEWSKPTLNGGIGKFEIKICSKDQNLNTSNVDLCPNKNNSITAKPMESCDPQKISTLNGILSSITDKCDPGQDNEAGESPEDAKQYISDVADSPQVKNIYQTNSNLYAKEQNDNLCNMGQRENYDVEALDDADNPNEECVQMTPPAADIFSEPEVSENGGDGVKCILRNVSQKVLGKPLSGSRCRNTRCINNKEIDSSPRQKLVPSQCSRLKLFKAPGSMSYRRMLPFLMDITKDNTSASSKGNCLKLEKCPEANLLSQSLVSDCQEMPIGNSTGNHCQAEHSTGGCSALPTVASSNDQELNFSPQKHVKEFPKPCNSQQELEVQFLQNLSDTERKFETPPEKMGVIHGDNPSATTLHSLFGSRSFSREDPKPESNASSLNAEENCTKSLIEITDGSKQIESDSLHQDSYHHETWFHLDIPATAFRTGILKKTPRGCRGLCTCLNCSSFHLHAQRAFEFSRHQMQDAEEVALDLMKELSYVRNMLEKSAFSDGHAAVCVNQVKEACRRACEAEEVAQKRLSQMNFDLNIHCRVTCAERPRVRFANHVEVNAESDLPRN